MAAKIWPETVVIYTDGACRGNPGPSAVGIHVTDIEGNTVDEIGEVLGVQTNNFAEYTAVKRAFEIAFTQKVKHITLRSDSQLLIRQMLGEYQVKSESIRPLFMACKKLTRQFQSVQFEHIRRELNQEADRLANLALDS